MISSADERRQSLKCRGRAPDPVFPPDERLFRACRTNEILGNHLAPDAVGFRDWSVKRERYSEASDVLLMPPRPGWGVAAFRVADVPTSDQLSGGPLYEFRVEHDPIDDAAAGIDNYAHSVIRTHKNGLYVAEPDPPKAIKKKFRQSISDRTLIEIAPQV